MKKLILTSVVAFAVSTYVMAQKDNGGFNQAKNSVEIGFNPFSNNFETFRIDELKYRHFFGNHAVRVRLGFGFTSDKSTNNANNGTFDPIITPASSSTSNYSSVSNRKEETITTTKKSEFNIFVGYEYHFNISRHMNIYAGAEVGFETVGGSEKEETTGSYNSNETNTWTHQEYNYPAGYTTVTHVSRTTTDRTYSSLREEKKKDAYGAFAFGLFTGIDVNIYKGLYLGAELGLQYKHKSFKAPEITNSGSSSTTITRYNKDGNTSSTKHEYESSNYSTDSEGLTTTTISRSGDDIDSSTSVEQSLHLDQTKKSSNSFKLYAAPALRIGWRF